MKGLLELNAVFFLTITGQLNISQKGLARPSKKNVPLPSNPTPQYVIPEIRLINV